MKVLVSPKDPFRSANQYIVDVIDKWRSVPVGINDRRIIPIKQCIKEWGDKWVERIFVTGSAAKGTSLKGNSDVDLFISLHANTPNTLKENYSSLFRCMKSDGYDIEKRNVALRIRYDGLKMDIVPGKRVPDKSNWHFLHTNRWTDTNRILTNVNAHVNRVIESGRINEIMALKIWRKINKLEFPSMYLEMYAIKELNGKWTGKAYLANNFFYLLERMSLYFLNRAVYDPANSSNIISDSLYKYEKVAISNAATKALLKKYLSENLY